ncbi:hypothetical protein P9112_006696 [Eukaryota sp. TZLM1-RC]
MNSKLLVLIAAECALLSCLAPFSGLSSTSISTVLFFFGFLVTLLLLTTPVSQTLGVINSFLSTVRENKFSLYLLIKPHLLNSTLLLSSVFLFIYASSLIFTTSLPSLLVPTICLLLKSISYSISGRSLGWTGSIFSRRRALSITLVSLMVLPLLFNTHFFKSVFGFIILGVSMFFFSFIQSKSTKKSTKVNILTFSFISFCFSIVLTLLQTVFSFVFFINSVSLPSLPEIVVLLALGSIFSVTFWYISKNSSNIIEELRFIFILLVLIFSFFTLFQIILTTDLLIVQILRLISTVIFSLVFVFIVHTSLVNADSNLDFDLRSTLGFNLHVAFSKTPKPIILCFLMNLFAIFAEVISYSLTQYSFSLLSLVIKLGYLIEFPIISFVSVFFGQSDKFKNTLIFGPSRIPTIITTGSCVILACGGFFGLGKAVETLLLGSEEFSPLFILFSLLSFVFSFGSPIIKSVSTITPTFKSAKINYLLCSILPMLCSLFFIILSLFFNYLHVLNFIFSVTLFLFLLYTIVIKAKWSSKILLLGVDETVCLSVVRQLEGYGEVMEFNMFNYSSFEYVLAVKIRPNASYSVQNNDLNYRTHLCKLMQSSVYQVEESIVDMVIEIVK